MFFKRKIECAECEATILPAIAEKYGGLCERCGEARQSSREKQRQFDELVSSRVAFVPSNAELESAILPSDLGGKWSLEPDFYAGSDTDSIPEIIVRAAQQSRGHVFLVSHAGGRVNLSFTERYGVCEYQNQDSGDFLYAFTQANLREQVPKEFHVEQACPCCGVGLLWFPSRFHMPREIAVDIIRSIANQTIPDEVRWLDSGDFSLTSLGHG